MGGRHKAEMSIFEDTRSRMVPPRVDDLPCEKCCGTGSAGQANRKKDAKAHIDKVREERNDARGTAAVLAHCHLTNNRPPPPDVLKDAKLWLLEGYFHALCDEDHEAP